MACIRQIYEETEKDSLALTLGTQRDVTATLSTVRRCLERVKQNYIAQENDQKLRQHAVMGLLERDHFLRHRPGAG